MSALLDVDDLVVAFPARGGASVKAVNNVSLQVARGEVLGIVGESGSGKTTLGRAILRLIEPTSGRISFDGQTLNDLSPRAMLPVRSCVGFFFVSCCGGGGGGGGGVLCVVCGCFFSGVAQTLHRL